MCWGVVAGCVLPQSTNPRYRAVHVQNHVWCYVKPKLEVIEAPAFVAVVYVPAFNDKLFLLMETTLKVNKFRHQIWTSNSATKAEARNKTTFANRNNCQDHRLIISTTYHVPKTTSQWTTMMMARRCWCPARMSAKQNRAWMPRWLMHRLRKCLYPSSRVSRYLISLIHHTDQCEDV